MEHNKTLLMKNLHKIFNREELPWVNLIWEVYYSSAMPSDKKDGSFWWKALINLIPVYKQACKCVVQSGTSIHL